MGVAKVVINDVTEIDLTADTVTEDTLSKGITAHNAKGEIITGTNTKDIDTSDATATASDILSGKTAYVNSNKITGTGYDWKTEMASLIERGNITKLPENITSIGSYAFNDCSKLDLTSLPDGVTNIGGSAFSYCSSLALTSLPEGLTSINNYAFEHCTNLALTSLPSGITSIGNWAFQYCTGLTSITFKGTPTTIYSSVFKSCTNLKDIYVPWSEGAVANAPWGATNATIHYDSTV